MSQCGQSKTEPRCVCVCVFAGRVFNGSGKPIDRGPAVLAEDFLDIMGQFSAAAVVVCVSIEKQMHGLSDFSSAKEDDSILLSSVDGTIFPCCRSAHQPSVSHLPRGDDSDRNISH